MQDGILTEPRRNHVDLINDAPHAPDLVSELNGQRETDSHDAGEEMAYTDRATGLHSSNSIHSRSEFTSVTSLASLHRAYFEYTDGGNAGEGRRDENNTKYVSDIQACVVVEMIYALR